MDFNAAKEYILDRLESELPPYLYYHGSHHTIDVYNATQTLASLENIDGYDLELLETAALYHDSGFLIQYRKNEDLSIKLSKEVLPKFNYTVEEIDIVCKMIAATRIPQKPKNLLERIICDADLDYLGRDDFFITAHKLHREWNEFGMKTSLKQWYQQQISFVESHRFFTKSAQELRENKKQVHLKQIYELIEGFESQDRYRDIFENMPIGLYRSTPDGQVLMANPHFLNIFEYSTFEELASRAIEIEEPNIAYSRKDFRSSLILNKEVSNYESCWQKADGSLIYIRENAKSVIDENGNVLFFDGTVMDVTEEYNTRREIETLNQRLLQLNKSYARFVPQDFISLLSKKEIYQIKTGDCSSLDLTILFSDIRSFTSLSENMSSHENFRFINSYLGVMTPLVKNNNGIIDKYIGDSIMALFPQSPQDAVVAAIEMQKKMMRYNTYRVYKNSSPIKIGIGIHTGNTMLGAVGNRDRLDITVVSDNVNVASRLQTLSRVYDSLILVSEDVYNVLDKDKFDIRYIGFSSLRNRNAPICIYEIILSHTLHSEYLKLKLKDDFEEAIRYFENGDYLKSKKMFESILDENPDDKATYLYIENCTQMIKDERSNWNFDPNINRLII